MENLSFSYQMDEFMLFCRSRRLREKTMNSYEQALRLFERWCFEQFNIESVDKITESVIRRYINDLMERGKYSFYADDKRKDINFPERRRDFRTPISITTINNYIRNLRVFFNWLERDYLIAKNPMKKIQQLKNERKAKEFISDEDFKHLIGNLDKSYFSEHRDLVMILLMLDTGMRLGECTMLLTEDIILAKRQIFLRAEITKGRKDRVVFFSPKSESMLRRWLQFKDRYAESDREWSKIKSCQDVEFLIKYFENCVLTSPFDIRTRNAYKFEMLVAQYKAMRGLRKWCQAIDGNPISPNPNFPKLNESDVEEIISRLEKIIRKI